MRGNYATTGFNATSVTDDDVTFANGVVFRDGEEVAVTGSTIAIGTTTGTTKTYTTGYHLVVNATGTTTLTVRPPTSVNAVPAYTDGDVIIAILAYTGNDPMQIQYLTVNKDKNSLSIARSASGTYTEMGTITADTNSLDIVTTNSNADIILDPHGTGDVKLGNLAIDGDQTVGSGQDGYALIYTHSNSKAALAALPASDAITDADGDTKIQVEESSDEDKIRFDTAGTERMIIDETGKVGIGTSSPTELLHLSDADASEPTILIENTGTSANEPELVFYRSTATGADSRDIGHVKFKARDTAGNIHTFAHFFVDSEDADTTTEDGRLIFYVTRQGTDGVEMLRLSGNSGFVFNEGGVDANFRIEGSSEANLFFTDAGNDRVGIGTNTPSTELDVQGDIRLSGEIEVNGDLNHDGSNVGFYGTAPATKQTVGNLTATPVQPDVPTNPSAAQHTSTQAAITALENKLNALIDALQLIGLIS